MPREVLRVVVAAGVLAIAHPASPRAQVAAIPPEVSFVTRDFRYWPAIDFEPGASSSSFGGREITAMAVGAGVGGLLAAAFTLVATPDTDIATARTRIICGAALGALAGYILTLPGDAEDESDTSAELRVGPFTAFVPPSGGIGLQLPAAVRGGTSHPAR